MSSFEDDDGWRSDVSRILVRRLAKKHDLIVEDQVNQWGKSRDFGVPRFRDAIQFFGDPG